jgi:hypothetical protein
VKTKFCFGKLNQTKQKPNKYLLAKQNKTKKEEYF